MAVCPLCGCKTDELDFVLCKIEDTETKVCSFCDKQIKKINADKEIAPAQLRWLESIASKDVEREQNVLVAINSLKLKHLKESNPENITAPVINQFTDFKQDIKFPTIPNGNTTITIDQYNKLVERLDKLENSFKKYKKAQLIKMIIELGAPVVMVIILLIILLSSGIFDIFTGLM